MEGWWLRLDEGPRPPGPGLCSGSLAVGERGAVRARVPRVVRGLETVAFEESF